ncbi:hypothetical protein N665_0103s0032 [Sinapis alba]|nr:hypothetical protein N665_0103s0032 [Sinapis alba]
MEEDTQAGDQKKGFVYVADENDLPASTVIVREKGWNHWERDTDQKSQPPSSSISVDLRKYCEYHKVKGHDTKECKQLHEALLASFSSGDAKVKPPRQQPKNNQSWSKNKDKKAQKARGKTPTSKLQEKGGATTPPDSEKDDMNVEEEQPRNCRRVEVIFAQPANSSADDAVGFHMPHNDPLLVELGIRNCKVTKVLVDSGSLVDLIFRGTLDKKGIDLRISTKDPYNVILCTPCIQLMKAITSTYHQCLKFPGPDGQIRTLRGDQQAARDLLIATVKLQQSTSHIKSIAEPIQKIAPRAEEILEVSIDTTDPSKIVKVGANLLDNLQEEIIAFLKQNTLTFAWTKSYMKCIDPSIVTHELNVDPTFKPIRQKRRKLGPKRSKAVNEDVEQLLAAGSITENNGKWRVSVDFTDLNKACPKYSYPLPHIDHLVESIVGNELLTFMDAFSGYNQIMMHPDDQEKTSFITDRGTYCYKVMPFGNSMEVYINDMMVKSLRENDHLSHLYDCFKTLNEYGMKLNPAKCTFGVIGIEANPKQISAILDLTSLKNSKEVQRLTGRIAALNRFIFRSTDKCLPFYELLRGNKKFMWDEKCEEALAQLKQYITMPSVLSKPEEGDIMSLYIFVSSTAVSSVLNQDDREEERPIFYTSKRMTSPETRYPTLEKMSLAVFTSARKLRTYFQSHSIEVLTNQPLRTVIEYDITYKNRTTTKSQVLVDFLIELSPELEQDLILLTNWILHVDGSSTTKGSGAGIQLQSPTGELIMQSFSFSFTASNNEAKYESLIAGLRLAKAIKAKRLSAYCDSQLVTSQFSGEYDARNKRMDAYLKLASGSSQTKNPIHRIDKPSIESADIKAQDAEQTSKQQDTDWRTEFIEYLADGRLPTEKWAARRLKARSSHYVIIDGELNRWTENKELLKCIAGDETRLIMAKTHEGATGNHSGGRSLALKIKHLEFLRTTTAPYPFMRWGMDIIGLMSSSRQRRLFLVLTDYLTKWIEAESFIRVTDKEVQGFVWKNIICRHGLPYEIITDTRAQFIASMPRHLQGNGQAESSNKLIIDGIKKHLDLKKGVWADELDGVLWSHQTTP